MKQKESNGSEIGEEFRIRNGRNSKEKRNYVGAA